MSADLNFWKINEELYQIAEECSDIQWAINDEDILYDMFDGDDEEAWNFRQEFTSLVQSCDQMREDINKCSMLDSNDEQIEPSFDDEPAEYIPTCFDIFFPACGADDLYGYDSYEDDYFRLDDYSITNAQKYAAAKLKRMTKDELIDAAGMCLRVAQQYLGLKYRYQCLNAALDVLRGENESLLENVKVIEELYAQGERDGWKDDWGTETEVAIKFDRTVHELPDRFWIE